MNANKYHVSKNLFDGEIVELDVGMDSNRYGFTITKAGTYTVAITGVVENGDYCYGKTYSNGEWSQPYYLTTGSTKYRYTVSINENEKLVIFNASGAQTYEQAVGKFNRWKIMANTGSQTLPYEPYGNTWHDIPHYIHNTSTDTITTLPVALYPNDTTATVGLKGNMEQSGTPTPSSPIQPQECGERTGNLVPEVSTENGWRKGFLSNGNYSPIQYYGEWLSPMISLDGLTEFTISAKPTSDASMSVYWFDDSTYLSQTNTTNYTGSTFDTIPSNATQFCYAIRTGVNGNTPPEGWWTMLNVGSTALPYEPYGYKIPISSNSITAPVYLSDVQSTRRIKKFVLTGNEGWNVTSKDSNRISCYIQLLCKENMGYCTHIVWKAEYSSDEYNRVVFSTYLGGSLFISLAISLIGGDTVNEFVAYLAQQYAAGTPVTVWYVLAEPTTCVVNEPIRKIGDYADEVSNVSIPTLAGTNTIDVDTTLKPSEVTVNYKGWHPVVNGHEASRTVNIYDKYNTIDIPDFGVRYGIYCEPGNYSIYNDTDNNVYWFDNGGTGRFQACGPHSTSTVILTGKAPIGFYMPYNDGSLGEVTIVQGSTVPDHYIPYIDWD